MPHAQVDDIRIHYERAGASEPALIFVHAYPTNCTLWHKQMSALSAKRGTLAYDVRGFGRSDVPESPSAYSQDRSVADLLGLLNALNIRKPAICGLSMGGNIALNFALKHPDRVGALIAADTGAGSDDATVFAQATNSWADLAERGGIDAFAAAILANPIFGEYAERGAAERDYLRGLILANTVRGVAHTARYVLAKRPTINSLVPRLQKLPVPTLVIVGAKDEPCIAPGETMAKNIPRAQLAVIPKTGHFNNLEEPEQFNRLLEDFLSANT